MTYYLVAKPVHRTEYLLIEVQEDEEISECIHTGTPFLVETETGNDEYRLNEIPTETANSLKRSYPTLRIATLPKVEEEREA